MNEESYRETERFQIRAEDGSKYEAIEITTFLHVYSHSGCSIIPSLKRLQTADGYHINFDGQQEYTIIELGLRAKRIATN